MRRKKYNFQVGDSVYTTKNSSWGRVPMTISKKYGTGAVCWHPEFETGWFHVRELCHANSDRAKQLKLLAEMEKKVDQLKHQLFS